MVMKQQKESEVFNQSSYRSHDGGCHFRCSEQMRAKRNISLHQQAFNPDHLIQTIKDIILENEPDIDTDTTVLDRQLGLKNMGGNEELYHQVLKEYHNENQDTLDRLEAAVCEKDTLMPHKSYIR